MARKTWEEIRAARVAADPQFEGGYTRERLNFQLAQVVYDLRTRAGLTQTELAHRIGTKQPHVARLEGGSVSPTIDLLQRLGDALDVRFVLRAEAATPGETIEVSFNDRSAVASSEVR